MKAFLPCLALCLAVCFCAAIWIAAPQARKPRVPARADAPTVRPDRVENGVLVTDSAPATALARPFAPTRKPERKPLPPAPALTPEAIAKALYVRVIDVDTNEPIANTPCELWRPVVTCCYQDWEGPQNSFRSAEQRPSDANGVVALSLPVEGDDRYKPTKSDLAEWHVSCPIPRGYVPLCEPWQVKDPLEKYCEGPQSQPFDLFVARPVECVGTILDERGLPVRGARIVAIPRSCSKLHLTPMGLTQEDYYSLCHEYSQGKSQLAKISILRPAVAAPAKEQTGYEPGELRQTARVSTPISDEQGQFRIPALAGAIFDFSISGPGYCTQQKVTRDELFSPQTFRVTASRQGSLVVTVAWLEDSLDQDDEYELEVTRADAFAFGARVQINAESKTTVRFDHVAATRYRIVLRTSTSDVDDYLDVELCAEQELPSTLYAGQNSRARWLPTFTFRGQPLDAAHVLQRREGERVWEDLCCTPEDSAYALAPRPHEFQFLDMPPRKVNLNPGERKSETIAIPERTVSLSVDASLLELLRGEQAQLTLDAELSSELAAATGLCELPGQRTAFYAALGEHDDTESATAWNFVLPPGVFQWKLTIGKQTLTGPLDLRGRGYASFYFSRWSLPGLAPIEIHYSEFEGDVPPDVAVASRELGGVKDQAARAFVAQKIEIPKEHLILLFAPPGKETVAYWHGSGYELISTQVPGHIELTKCTAGDLKLVSAEKSDNLAGLAFDSQGRAVLLGPCAHGADITESLRQGPWTLSLNRSVNGKLETARVHVNITETETIVRDDSISWQSSTELKVLVTNPEIREQLEIKNIVVAAIATRGNFPSSYQLWGNSENEDGTVELYCELPPGSYKLVLLIGAERRELQTFEVGSDALTLKLD